MTSAMARPLTQPDARSRWSRRTHRFSITFVRSPGHLKAAMSLHKRVLMTGHKGYIGSVMAPFLRRAGHEVVGLDTEYFGECTLVPDRDPIAGIRKDIRDLEPRDVEGFDAVVHLAALSNDPVGNLNERWTAE